MSEHGRSSDAALSHRDEFEAAFANLLREELIVTMVTMWPRALSARPRPITGWTSPELPMVASRIRKGILDGGPTLPRLKDRHPAVFERKSTRLNSSHL